MKEENIYTTRRYSAREMILFKKSDLTLREFNAFYEDKFDIENPLLYQHILNLCSYVVDIDPILIISKNRKSEIVFARYMTMYFMKKLSDQYKEKVGKVSSTQLGEMIGGKDHATVLWGLKAVENVLFVGSKTDQRTAWVYSVHEKLQKQLGVSIDISINN